MEKFYFVLWLIGPSSYAYISDRVTKTRDFGEGLKNYYLYTCYYVVSGTENFPPTDKKISYFEKLLRTYLASFHHYSFIHISSFCLPVTVLLMLSLFRSDPKLLVYVH